MTFYGPEEVIIAINEGKAFEACQHQVPGLRVRDDEW
jgi:hypothetical protein